MIIYSKAHRVIKDHKGKQSFEVQQGYVGTVPDWVTTHPYFKLNCGDGTFTVQADTVTVAAEKPAKAPKKTDTGTAKATEKTDAATAKATEKTDTGTAPSETTPATEETR
jgi:hypothetical protein